MSNGNHVAALAPIIETDDIVVDGGEQQSSALNTVPPVAANATVSRTPTFRRPSLMSTTVEFTRRAIERHAPNGLSVSAMWDRICSVGSKHDRTPSEVIRAMKPRARMGFYLAQPEDSQLGWLLHHLMLFILLVNVAIMAAETLDGPRFGSTQPAYPYLPDDAFFLAAENGFTVIYIADFIFRAVTASSQKVFWRSTKTWMKVVAWIPALVYQGLYVLNKHDPSFNSMKVRESINYLRLARLARIISMTRVYVGSKVMFKATKDSVAPLKITLFFLITVVMVFATAIFYAEPCYDLKTCTFTDIFNAGYFVMTTVATVGYGSQVPSLHNGGSVFLTIIIMIFGSLYLAMPLAIVGIRYDSAWRDFEQAKRESSRSSLHSGSSLLAQVAANAGSKVGRDARRLHQAQQRLMAKYPVDETLQPLESGKVYTISYRICDRFCDMAQIIGELSELIRVMFEESSMESAPSPSSSPRSSVTVQGGVGDALRPSSPGGGAQSADDKASDALLRRVKSRNEGTVKVLEMVTAVLKLHKKITSEIRGLLPAMDHGKSALNVRSSSGTHSMTRREGSFSKAATNVFGRARRALSSVTGSRRGRFVHAGSPTWRSRTWDVLDHNDVSRRAGFVNRIRLYLVVLSIALFYAQTTPELQATGVKTSLCRRSLADFCHNSSPGFSDQLGCFVLDSAGKATSTPLEFECIASSTDPTCYGNAYNFGSDLFPSTCAQVFGRKGTQRICNNRLCKPPVTLWVDMEHKWIRFEFFFGIMFTAEMILRVIVHPQPKQAYRDMAVLIDLIALFPFYVEVGEIIAGKMPVYSIVPTAPSFFAIIRVLKTFRVLKLGPHISGSEVLARTAYLVYKRLMIPVFFLFIGSLISGAIFYELERGTECFVGKKCVWWGKELLTPAIIGNNPPGKRLMVQDNRLTLIPDMMRSTWFSIVTMTTVGYGDMRPRTALGRFFDILLMIISACYTAMPLTLVGGQFYVCYEVYLRDKRRNRPANTIVEPKQTNMLNEVAMNGSQEQVKDVELREPTLMSLAGLTDEPVIPGLNAPIAAPLPSGPALATRRGINSFGKTSKEPTRPTISSAEHQLLNRFILIFKVLNEVIEDLSHMNKLGSQRMTVKKDKPDELAHLMVAEGEIRAKIDNNLVFCATVVLNFAPVVEKIIGVQEQRPAYNGVAMPSILHSASAQTTAGTPTASVAIAGAGAGE